VVNYPYDDTATCNGDSGGPLIAAGPRNEPIEIGITSTVPTDCDTVSADYFTSVVPLSSWVAGEVQAVAPPPPSPPPAPSTPAPQPPATNSPPSPTQPSTQPTLPRMTTSAARSHTKQALAGALGRAFARRYGYQPGCRRTSSTRFNCEFMFSSGPNDYYGNVIVYLVSGSGGQVQWTDRYNIYWVNYYCYFHSGHRRRCNIHAKQGTY
jgi:hypothetical protein